MKYKLDAYHMVFNNDREKESFARTVPDAIFRNQQRRVDDDDLSWMVEVGVGRTKDAFQLQVYIGVDRDVLTDDPNQRGQLAQVPFREYEIAKVNIIVDHLVLAVQRPQPKTREYTPAQIRDFALTAVKRHFARNGLPDYRLRAPEGDRSREWFVGRILEVAASTNERLVSATIYGMHGSSQQDDIDVFNPDFTMEEVGRMFFTRGNEGLAESTHRSTKDGDLSHNPTVRGQIRSGFVRAITIATRHGRREVKRPIKKERSSDMTVEASANSLQDLFDAIRAVLGTGEYDVE